MDVAEQIKELKKEFRANMNGVASKYMRENGLNYHVNFGIELPRLIQIASDFPHDYRLAQQLWNENVRESKMVAAMLMPLDSFDHDLAEIWVDEIPNAEIAQATSLYLFSKLTFACDIAFEWMASDSEKCQLCGFLIIGRILSQGGQFNERAEAEFLDQVASLLSSRGNVADDSSSTPSTVGGDTHKSSFAEPLRKAAFNALQHYASLGSEESDKAEAIFCNISNR